MRGGALSCSKAFLITHLSAEFETPAVAEWGLGLTFSAHSRSWSILRVFVLFSLFCFVFVFFFLFWRGGGGGGGGGWGGGGGGEEKLIRNTTRSQFWSSGLFTGMWSGWRLYYYIIYRNVTGYYYIIVEYFYRFARWAKIKKKQKTPVWKLTALAVGCETEIDWMLSVCGWSLLRTQEGLWGRIALKVIDILDIISIHFSLDWSTVRMEWNLKHFVYDQQPSLLRCSA